MDENEMYAPGSIAVERMADAFFALDREATKNLTDAQMRTIAAGLRALHPSQEWIGGFAAAMYVMTGQYQKYAIERDAWQENRIGGGGRRGSTP